MVLELKLDVKLIPYLILFHFLLWKN